jgi:single-strand DNA-binding protein
MNKIFITGNLVRDPDKRVTTSGINVCSFTVAVNRRRRDQNQPTEADYFHVTVWRELAESCGKYLAKGRKVAVTGSASLSTYQAKTGETRATIEVDAQEVEFLSPAEKKTEEKHEDKSGFVEVPDDEDIPF